MDVIEVHQMPRVFIVYNWSKPDAGSYSENIFPLAELKNIWAFFCAQQNKLESEAWMLCMPADKRIGKLKTPETWPFLDWATLNGTRRADWSRCWYHKLDEENCLTIVCISSFFFFFWRIERRKKIGRESRNISWRSKNFILRSKKKEKNSKAAKKRRGILRRAENQKW